MSEDLLTLHFRIEGALDQLLLPPRRRSSRTDGLWHHTCFETYIRCGETRAYLEFNFSPSSEWAIYSFDDYRHNMHLRVPQRSPEIVCNRRTEDLLEVDVSVQLDGLLPEHARVAGLHLGVAAMLEDQHGQLSYWALAHPAARPDFHHADSFVLSLSQPGVAA